MSLESAQGYLQYLFSLNLYCLCSFCFFTSKCTLHKGFRRGMLDGAFWVPHCPSYAVQALFEHAPNGEPTDFAVDPSRLSRLAAPHDQIAASIRIRMQVHSFSAGIARRKFVRFCKAGLEAY